MTHYLLNSKDSPCASFLSPTPPRRRPWPRGRANRSVASGSGGPAWAAGLVQLSILQQVAFGPRWTAAGPDGLESGGGWCGFSCPHMPGWVWGHVAVRNHSQLRNKTAQAQGLCNMLAKLVPSNIFENSVVGEFCVFSSAKTSLLTPLLLCLPQGKARGLQIVCTFPTNKVLRQPPRSSWQGG